MGNTANFQGSALYAVQHVLTIHGVWGEKRKKKKTKDEALSSNLITRPHVSNNYKV